MKIKTPLLLLLLWINFFYGCTSSRNTITQVSTIDALLVGAYDGQMSCGELLKYGNCGIGTFHALDGEMTVMDGKVYQIKADGKLYQPESSTLTPFASVTDFSRDIEIPIDEEMTLEDIQKKIDSTVGNKNIFYTLKIKGYFKKVKTRSVPAQKKPYPFLVEVTQHQSVFNFSNVEGTMIGFRFPDFMKGVNVPGYHLHFLTHDLKGGGHILEFTMAKGVVEVDLGNRFFMILPEGKTEFSTLDLSRDRSKDLEKAEK